VTGVPAGPRVLALDHVQLAMPAGGEEHARSFYGNLLGMPEVSKPEPLRARGGAWFRAGAAELHLGVDPDFRPARKAHPAIRCDDLDALAVRLDEAGHLPVWDGMFPGVRRFHVSDPFGNRLEFLEAS
jgi:catechol 2,3-dioxygenase-like lactoylglutathione lyase family enzyme